LVLQIGLIVENGPVWLGADTVPVEPMQRARTLELEPRIGHEVLLIFMRDSSKLLLAVRRPHDLPRERIRQSGRKVCAIDRVFGQVEAADRDGWGRDRVDQRSHLDKSGG